MKAVVLVKYFDKKEDKIFSVGDVISVNKERFEAVNKIGNILFEIHDVKDKDEEIKKLKKEIKSLKDEIKKLG